MNVDPDDIVEDEIEQVTGKDVLYFMFIPRCKSNRCSRKLRVKFVDEHVIVATPADDGFDMAYIEGKGIAHLTAEDPHAMVEFAIVQKLAEQQSDWLHGAVKFSGIDN